MPLVTFTGLPSSGKTKFAKQLVDSLQKRIEESKTTKEPGHNYSVIYHYCEAKGLATPHCVVHVVSSVDHCVQWNREWDEEVIRQLAMRYEEPNGDTRWDSPLFTVVAADDNETLPIDEMWDCLVLKKVAPPNAATLVKPTSGNNFLQELDQKTQAVISAIVQHQQIASIGGQVKVEDMAIDMPAHAVSTAQLQRIRRTFVALNRMRSIDIDRITSLFVEYINRTFESE